MREVLMLSFMKDCVQEYCVLTRFTLREKEPTGIEDQVKKQRVAKYFTGGQYFFSWSGERAKEFVLFGQRAEDSIQFCQLDCRFGKDELISFFFFFLVYVE